MSYETASALSSLWFTYVLQSAAGCAVLWLLSRFVRDRQFRFCLCGVVLGGMVACWAGLLALLALSVSDASDKTALAQMPNSHWSWTLSLDLTPWFATVLSFGRWIYVAVLIVLLVRFCGRFWQLKTLLLASRPPSEPLSSLFESVCSEIKAPRCELRLIPGLRSPAAAGWFRPRVLLPEGLASRLEIPQLVGILRHELIHVRRRDYVWDRLATLGCYLVFFQPAAWLLRRQLRWDRELVCDEGSVDHSDQVRLEYAGCLTTLANWQLHGDELVGPIDFLSSPSLLATRVRALVSPHKANYSASQKATLACLIAVSLTLALRLVPRVMVSPISSQTPIPTVTEELVREPRPQSEIVSPVEQTRLVQRHESSVPKAKAPGAHPKLTSSASNIRGAISGPPGSSQSKAQPGPTRRGSVWRFIPKVGGWAIRSVKVGFTKVGSHLTGHRSGKAPSGQVSSVATATSERPL
jgi:beta-lactamase regulating signal transducer with metallopeptidase domain